jgi:hypothetical protein
MKYFTSALFGAVALAGAALATAPAAEARSGVAIQIGPGGFAIGIDEYRDYCRDRGYRHRYYQNCNRYSFNDDYYSDRGEYYRWSRSHRGHRHNYYNSRYDRDHDGRHDRDHHRDRDDRRDHDHDNNNWR